ncbi:hypothetical protein MSG28_008391 [Choristoneura fumiferana]|uniref:Uncharacterized protein n=1 Tax=Choristoneura fumiferana TaxID=7141 RepID=A0ACC0J4B4_CHOFU|nr:hypothetical protein MSG28_008391 [Choristoneura fumiferana]
MKDEQFSEYLSLARERDARYTLYFENLALQLRLRELSGGAPPAADGYADPAVLRLALDRCREQLSSTQRDLAKMTDEYSETVPRREFDCLENKANELGKEVEQLQAELAAVRDKCQRALGKLGREGKGVDPWEQVLRPEQGGSAAGLAGPSETSASGRSVSWGGRGRE